MVSKEAWIGMIETPSFLADVKKQSILFTLFMPSRLSPSRVRFGAEAVITAGIDERLLLPQNRLYRR
jgi:hypothetical protein